MSRKKPNTPTARETRLRHEKVVLAYAEEAGEIGIDPEKDRAAQIRAMERGGYTKHTTERGRLRKFKAIWGSDASRELLYRVWGFEIPEAPDPLAVMQRVLYEHMTQTDESWGPRDRGASLQAVAQASKMFVPAQTAKIDKRTIVAHVDRPQEFAGGGAMTARNVLASTTGVGVTTSEPAGDDEEDEDDPD